MKIKSQFYPTASVLLLYLLPAIVNIFLSSLEVGFSPLISSLVPSIILLKHQDELMRASDFSVIGRLLLACFFLIFGFQQLTRFLNALLVPFLLASKITLLSYFARDLIFFICTGLYLLFYYREKGSLVYVCATDRAPKWRDFFLGLAGCSLFFFVFHLHILTTVPTVIMCLALLVSFVVTGVQSLFEELVDRMAPLSFFKEAQKCGLSKNIAFLGHMFISVVVFAISHVSNFLLAGLYGIAVQLVMGLVWGIVSWLAGGIEYSTGLHAANNILCFLFIEGTLLNSRIAISPLYLWSVLFIVDFVSILRTYCQRPVETEATAESIKSKTVLDESHTLAQQVSKGTLNVVGRSCVYS